MSKTEVYSWRIAPEQKSALEEAARAEQISMAQLLDRIVADWLERSAGAEGDEARQQRLHEAARRCFGTLQNRGPDFAETAKATVRDKLHYERQGTD